MPSKRYQKAASAVQSDTPYPLEEAVKLLNSTSPARFDASVELHMHLGIDPSQSDQQVRISITLPHGTGKTKRIAVFGDPAAQEAARNAGAATVGGEELIAAIKASGKCDFDIAIATPPMMPKLAGIAKILGPKGLMPSPKNDTITTNVGKTIGELQGGKMTIKNDTTGNIHLMIGKVSWEPKTILENAKSAIDAITKAKPSTQKGTYLQSVTLTTTMGPGIRISL